VVQRLGVSFEHAGFVYAVVGAFARNAWARPRATTDVDFAIAIESSQLPELHRLLSAIGLIVRKERAGEGDVPELILLCAKNDDSVRVDLLVASTPFEHSVLSRRRRVALADLDLWVASPEDLLVYKLVAGRARDLADVEEVARTRELMGHPIDWGYVEEWTEAFGVADRTVTLRAKLAP
jgi:predicted nucleotidyltransferase